MRVLAMVVLAGLTMLAVSSSVQSQPQGVAEQKERAAAEEVTPAEYTKTFPVIAGHGAVVQLPHAAMQPRSGTRLLVDITRGHDPAELNDAIEKVARFVNLFAGGGEQPAKVQIAVVFHGDATLDILKQEAYSSRFNTPINPNLELLEQLHSTEVQFYVCGQSLISKGGTPEEVAPFVKTAVSAMTAVVNLQTDGYAYLPLGK
ncbi:MAG: DsrE family protein [Planctomycetaceae bacterium]